MWEVPRKANESGRKQLRIVVVDRKSIDPIPNMSNISDKLGKSQYLTTLRFLNKWFPPNRNTVSFQCKTQMCAYALLWSLKRPCNFPKNPHPLSQDFSTT